MALRQKTLWHSSELTADPLEQPFLLLLAVHASRVTDPPGFQGLQMELCSTIFETEYLVHNAVYQFERPLTFGW